MISSLQEITSSLDVVAKTQSDPSENERDQKLKQ